MVIPNLPYKTAVYDVAPNNTEIDLKKPKFS